MTTELKDVLHLYLGCQCKMDDGKVGRLSGLDLCQNDNSITMLTIRFSDDINDDWSVYNDDSDFSRIKPILHRLEDMTGQHIIGLGYGSLLDIAGMMYTKSKISVKQISEGFTADEFLFLLKNSYDLFNLIDSGQAIDYKTIK